MASVNDVDVKQQDTEESNTSTQSEDEQWNFNKSLSQRNLYLLKNSIFYDTIFQLNNKQEVCAHRIFLISSSPVFEEMYLSKSKVQKCKNLYKFQLSIDARIFELMLTFIYSDFVEINSFDDAHKLALLSEKFQIERLKKLCISAVCNYLDLKNVEKALEIKYLSPDITGACEQIINEVDLNFLSGSSFCRSSKEFMYMFLTSTSSVVTSEIDIILATFKWGRQEAIRQGLPPSDDSVRKILVEGNLLKHLRFLSLNDDEYRLVTAYNDIITIFEITAHTCSRCLSALKSNEDKPLTGKPRIAYKKSSWIANFICTRSELEEDPEIIKMDDDVIASCVFTVDKYVQLLGFEMMTATSTNIPYRQRSDFYVTNVHVVITDITHKHSPERKQNFSYQTSQTTCFPYDSSFFIRLTYYRENIFLEENNTYKIEVHLLKGTSYKIQNRSNLVEKNGVKFKFNPEDFQSHVKFDSLFKSILFSFNNKSSIN